MRILLDTHLAVCAVAAPKRLSSKARDIIEDGANEICVSAITVAEIAIKHMLGKRSDVMPFSSAVAIGYFVGAGYALIDLTSRHAAALERLPPLHKDPFDRLLIAQALAEPCHLATHDSRMAAYGDCILLV